MYIYLYVHTHIYSLSALLSPGWAQPSWMIVRIEQYKQPSALSVIIPHQKNEFLMFPSSRFLLDSIPMSSTGKTIWI